MESIPPNFTQARLNQLWDEWSKGHLEIVCGLGPEQLNNLKMAFTGGFLKASCFKQRFAPVKLTFRNVEAIRQHILRNVIKQPNGCWEWCRGRSSEGYGVISIDRRQYRASRVSSAVFKGFDLSSPLLMCHTCDNPPCINPDHLLPETGTYNVQDSIRKGRFKPSSVTAAKVRSIRKLAKMGFGPSVIRKIYGISKTTIRQITIRATWQNIEDEPQIF